MIKVFAQPSGGRSGTQATINRAAGITGAQSRRNMGARIATQMAARRGSFIG